VGARPEAGAALEGGVGRVRSARKATLRGKVSRRSWDAVSSTARSFRHIDGVGEARLVFHDRSQEEEGTRGARSWFFSFSLLR